MYDNNIQQSNYSAHYKLVNTLFKITKHYDNAFCSNLVSLHQTIHLYGLNEIFQVIFVPKTKIEHTRTWYTTMIDTQKKYRKGQVWTHKAAETCIPNQ